MGGELRDARGASPWYTHRAARHRRATRRSIAEASGLRHGGRARSPAARRARHIADAVERAHRACALDLVNVDHVRPISDRAARQVARETGARYGGVLYVDSLSAAGGPTPTYLDMLRVTVETIVKGLGR